jgi:predicted nucleotidyltransferase
MKEQLSQLINERSPGSKPIFLVIRGSHAYGTNIETSDTDYAGVFIQSLDDILGSKYKQQVNDDTNDTVIYELRRFLELLASNNPTVLELLNTPEECIIYKDPIFDLILENREQFITKICANSFGGYARAQIGKAKGQNKKQNWEKDKVTRKDLLDFCYVIQGTKAIPWKKWNDGRFDERFIGAVNVPYAKDVYTLFYDSEGDMMFSGKEKKELSDMMIQQRKDAGLALGLGYKGLVKVGSTTIDRSKLTNMTDEQIDRLELVFQKEAEKNLGVSNQLRLSSIPKGQEPFCTITYNKDGYSEHCKDFREYEEWLSKRNLQRWVDVKSHGQQIDGKNMMHCRRLMDMAREIAEGKGILVRRDNAQELLSIRRGEIDLQTLIDHVESEIKEVDTLFKESNLPEKVDENFINSLLVKIRKSVYGIQ